MAWKLQSWLWYFLPEDRAVNLTLYVFGLLLAICCAAFLVGWFLRKRWLRLGSMGIVAAILCFWGFLFLSRPLWLQIAAQADVPMPQASELKWTSQAPGLETAELTIWVDDVVVDRMMLTRLDTKAYRFSVHYDPTGTRTATDWQRELDAAVVVNGSYFDADFQPLTPIKASNVMAGPKEYRSSHGAFVTDGHTVEIKDLRDKDVFKALDQYPEAMVSYPLLVDPMRENRAFYSKSWLASRNFIALDNSGYVVLGTTETGFFTIYRLGEFLKSSALNIAVALNLDGGPLVSQIVRAGSFTRDFHGIAEISNDNDLLRVFWHSFFETNWQLPIVLAAQPISN